MSYNVQYLVLESLCAVAKSRLDSVVSSPDSVFALLNRVLVLQSASRVLILLSPTGSALLQATLASQTAVVQRVDARSAVCVTGTCPFNYNIRHGMDPTVEYFKLSKEGSDDIVFHGVQEDENRRMLGMTCVPSGTYTLTFSSHYADMSNPLLIYGMNKYADTYYTYSSTNKEITISC